MNLSILKSPSFLLQMLICIIVLIISIFASSFYISLKYDVSLHSKQFITKQFLRMSRDTSLEEPIGYALFLPAGSHMATTKKRDTYTGPLLKKLWDRAVSGSSPLIFTEKRKKGVIKRAPKKDVPETVESQEQCLVNLMNERDWSNMNLQWKSVSGVVPEAWQREHAFLDPVMVSAGATMTQMRICGVPASNDPSKVAPVQNLRQTQREELWCYIGATSESSPRLKLLTFDPLQTDALLPLEGQNIMTSSKLRDYYNAAQVLGSKKKRSSEDPEASMESSYIPAMKLGDVTRGDCVFVPSFWWVTAMVQSPSEITGENVALQDMQLTRTEYLPHSAVTEVVVKTVRRTLGADI